MQYNAAASFVDLPCNESLLPSDVFADELNDQSKTLVAASKRFNNVLAVIILSI
jgi:hypothetical protein